MSVSSATSDASTVSVSAAASGNTTTAAAAPSAPDAPSANPPQEALPPGAAGLFARLAKEKQSRPTGTPTTEATFDAFRKNGLAVVEPGQVFGATVGAAYCESAKGHDVYMSVCEYPTEADAKAGRDYSLKTFASVPNRQIVVNKKTTLTVGQVEPTAQGTAEAKQLTAAFAKL